MRIPNIDNIVMTPAEADFLEMCPHDDEQLYSKIRAARLLFASKYAPDPVSRMEVILDVSLAADERYGVGDDEDRLQWKQEMLEDSDILAAEVAVEAYPDQHLIGPIGLTVDEFQLVRDIARRERENMRRSQTDLECQTERSEDWQERHESLLHYAVVADGVIETINTYNSQHMIIPQ